MFLRSDSADVEFINGFVAFLTVDLVELGHVGDCLFRLIEDVVACAVEEDSKVEVHLMSV